MAKRRSVVKWLATGFGATALIGCCIGLGFQNAALAAYVAFALFSIPAIVCMYVAPWRVAVARNHPHAEAIGIVIVSLAISDLLSLFLGPAIAGGWTLIGWIVCMAWACLYKPGGNCWQCHGRLNGFPSVCQFCGAPQRWSRASTSIYSAAFGGSAKLNSEDPEAWRKASDPIYAAEAKVIAETQVATERKARNAKDSDIEKEVIRVMCERN